MAHTKKHAKTRGNAMKYGWECFKRSGQHPSPTLQSEAAALSFPLRRFLCKTSTQTSVQEVIVVTVQTRPMATSCNLSKVPRAYLTVLNCTSFPAFLPGGNVCSGQAVQRDRTSHGSTTPFTLLSCDRGPAFALWLHGFVSAKTKSQACPPASAWIRMRTNPKSP